ncbi:MAG TPA: hypothetical protein VE967_05445 [Gemmatimonadaceae bacterium]|nr:hypothetical protein [Gemmatimonadaceae bacterium]
MHATRRLLLVLPVFVAAAACGGGDKVQYSGLYASTVRRSIPAIEQSTGHKYKSIPKLEERTREELHGFLERAFQDQTPALELDGLEGSYKRFGMVPDTMDLRRYMLRLLDEQVLGYYDPKTKILYVMKDAAPELVGTTVSHELVHALQDQYFPLDSLERIKKSNDRRTAGQAVAEGQAVWEQLVVLTGAANPANAIPGGWDAVRNMIRDNQSNMPILDAAPTLLRETLLFPYLSGAEHIRQFKQRVPTGWPFDSLPESTEQVMHPEKYFGTRDHPTDVTLPPLQNGARSVYENDLGEFETRLFVFEHTRDQALAVRAAAGWDGDRYVFMTLPGGGDGVVWATVWDTPVDAAEFTDALDTALPKRYRGLKRKTDVAGAVHRFEGGGRTVEVRAVTVDGRPVVLYTDVPAGAGLNVVDAARIRLSQ